MKIKKITLLIISFCFNCILSYAQNNTKGLIKGKVIEEVGALPIPGAVISLIEESSDIPMLTFQTDADGNFKFENLKLSKYKLKISFIGFNTAVFNDIEITKSNPEYNIGNVKLLESANSLNEVVISNEKPLIETDGDVITYNVGSSIHAEGSSAVDILKDVPMVEVDIDGKPSISGMRSTRVFINGKPSDYMTSNIADLLNVLPSDAVEKIEVMTNPPAKYSADGEGIINIVLRKDFKVGFNGNLSAGYGTQGNKNAGLNASYKGKNYNINGGGSWRNSNSRSQNSNYRTNLFADTTYYYNQFNDSDVDNGGKNARVALNWDIDKRQNLRVSTNYSKSDADGMAYNDFYYVNEELIEKRLQKQQNSYIKDAETFVINADYDFRIDTIGNKLSLGLTANKSKSDLDRVFDRHYVFPVQYAPSLQSNGENSYNKGINFNLDYEKITSDRKHRFEAGTSLGLRENSNNLLVQNYNFKTNQYKKNLKLSNDFLYNEKILAFYASYNYRLNGWSAKAAIRTEYTNVNFELADSTSFNLTPYWSLFPSFSIGKFFKKKYNISLNYGMRINRPRENTLNPQINDTDTLNIFYGNPNLTPSYTHQLSLSFGIYGKNWTFNPRITYSRALSVIERYKFVFPNGRSETTFDNIGSNYYLTYTILGNYHPSKVTSFNANMTLTQSNYNSTKNAYLNKNGYSFLSRIGMALRLYKTTYFESNLNYVNSFVAQGRNKSSVSTSFGLRQSFLKNRLSLRVTTRDPFRAKRSYSYNAGPNYNAENFRINNTRNISFQLVYRYTKIKVDKVKVPPASKVVNKAATK